MPIELPDGSQYFPPRVTASNRGDHAFKTSGNPLLAGLFLPMKGTKDLFRVKLMDRRRVRGTRNTALDACCALRSRENRIAACCTRPMS